jgi:CTP:molybdopterin cytidylyltransferase MocA
VWRVTAAGALDALVEAGARRADAAFALGVTPVLRPGSELVDLDTPDDVARFGATDRAAPPGS